MLANVRRESPVMAAIGMGTLGLATGYMSALTVMLAA